MILLMVACVSTGVQPHMPEDLSSSALVFNEFMATPLSSATEAEGEWIELYNRSDDYVNLSGWRIRNQSGIQIICGTYLLPPDGYVVLGSSGDSGRNGGYSPDQVYSGFGISATGSLMLIEPGGQTAETLVYDSSWPVEPGCSCERINPNWTIGLSSSWAAAVFSFGDGDKGTPGEKNSVYENSFASNTWAFIKAFVQ